MTTLALRRADGFFWVQVAGAALLWLVAWFAALPVATWVAYDLLGLEPGTPVGDAIAFFLFDVAKVLLLLTGVVTAVSFLRGFVSPERVRAALAGRGDVRLSRRLADGERGVVSAGRIPSAGDIARWLTPEGAQA